MVDIPIQHLVKLSESKIIHPSIIQAWLKAYNPLYRSLSVALSKMYLYEIDGRTVRLPPMNLGPSKEEMLVEDYEYLKRLMDFYSYESYFESEINVLNDLLEDIKKVEKWLTKNEVLGSKKFVCFMMDYLDYADNPNHLMINLKSTPKPLWIEKNSFQHTIHFLEKFDELYW